MNHHHPSRRILPFYFRAIFAVLLLLALVVFEFAIIIDGVGADKTASSSSASSSSSSNYNKNLTFPPPPPRPPAGARYCVDTTTTVSTSTSSSSSAAAAAADKEDVLVCSDHPLHTRRKYEPASTTLAGLELTMVLDALDVPQRVDGTEKERQGILSIMEQANAYYYGEVLSNPDFRRSRKFCRNANELCSFWAYVGECKTNRLFMLPNCPKACRFCLLYESLMS